MPAVGTAKQERPLRRQVHNEPKKKRPIGMLELQMLHAQLTPADFKLYCDSSFSGNKRAEPAAQRQGVMVARFKLSETLNEKDNHVCTFAASV